MSVRRWAMLTGGLALAVSGAFLAMWLSGVPELVRFAAWRGKTNTCIGLVFGATALLLRSAERRRAPRIASGLVAAMTALGALTLAEYALGVNLGIDELIAQDWPFAESAAHPNRMSPHAAVSFVMLGAVFALAARPGHRLARLGQWIALALIALDAAALVGYLYNATRLYQAGTLLRITPYTALCFVLLAAGSFALRPELGVVPRFRGDGIGAYLARRLLVPIIAGPILLALLRVQGTRRGWWTEPVGEAFEVMLYIAVFAGLVLYVARSLDALDARRMLSEQELRRAGELTAALAQASSVEEVARATIDLGLPALGAEAGSVYVFEPAEPAEPRLRLRLLATTGYPADRTERYDRIALDAALPVCEAVRERAAVYVASVAEFRARYPGVHDPRTTARAWAALPLEGRERMLGVIGLSFAGAAPDEQARKRIDRLTSQCGQALDRAVLFDSEHAAREAARAASRAKDEFLAMLGHELRNPLAPIAVALELMRIRDPGPNRERDVIERQVRHMTRLVGDLLDVSRIAGGKVELVRTRVELAEMVHDAAELVRPLVDERRHALTVDVAPGLVVDGDRARLVQVVSNLIANAAKFTPVGGAIAIAARREADTVVLRVTDTGVGVPAALLPRIFELFVQGEHALDRATGGLGLGLAIVHSLVTLHGGTITAASEGEGRGATFVVTLPVASSPAADEAPAPPPLAPAAAARRVLLVDDNTDAAELMGEALELAGYTVRLAHDGERALALAAEFDPDCVMLDIGLPILDGYEVARRLRVRDGDHHRVLVAMTGYGQDEDVQRSLAAGFDRHLVKPVSLAIVLEIIASSTARIEP